LESIRLSNSLNYIGEKAFSECGSLKSIDIPDSVEEIGKEAFSRCLSLTSAKISASMTVIASNLFFGCRNLTEVTIPASVETVGDLAFMSCTSLKTIVLPSSVKYLDVMAFCYCSNLEYLSYLGVNPPSKSDKNVFYGCNKLKEVTVPTCYKSSSCWGFQTNKSLLCHLCGDDVVFEYDSKIDLLSLTGEGDMYDFSIYNATPWSSYSKFIKKVIIGSGVTSIGSYSFNGCINMENAIIGEKVSVVGDEAFYKCKKLKNVNYKGSKAPSYSGIVFEGCTMLNCIDVPDTYTSNTFCEKPVCT